MFRTVVSVQLVDRRSRRAVMQRTVDLPFAPAPMMELGFIDPGTDAWSGCVEQCIWSFAENCFHVELEDWASGRYVLEDMIADLGPEWRRIDVPKEPAA